MNRLQKAEYPSATVYNAHRENIISIICIRARELTSYAHSDCIAKSTDMVSGRPLRNGASLCWAGTRYMFAHLAACSDPKAATSVSVMGQFHGARVLFTMMSPSNSMSW